MRNGKGEGGSQSKFIHPIIIAHSQFYRVTVAHP
jgi:hypothetical protein